MLEFLNLNPEAFGIDISDLSIKVVKLDRKGSDFRLASFGETAIKPGIIKGGEIRNDKQLVEIIKKAVSSVQGKKIRLKHIVASLPEEKAFLQVIQMPRLPEEDLKSAVIYEAENYIPIPIQDVYLDSRIIQPLANHLDHQDVLIAAMPKKIVDSYLICFKKAGLKPLALEIESLAIARALVPGEICDAPLLLIDFGATKIGFFVFSGRSLRFTSSIPVSSQKLTEAISRSLKMDFAKAEKLKLKYGLETRATKEGGDVFDALVPPLTDLTEQIKKHLDFYQTHASHEHLPKNNDQGRMIEGGVEKIVLCGGGAGLKGLADFLSAELKIQVEIANPWINFLKSRRKSSFPLSFEISLRYTTALGLAIKGAQRFPL